MGFYDNEHSVSVKRFLGVEVPAQDTPDPATSLRIALDRLASHPRVAKFICKKLIRRFISDTPKQALIDSAAAIFRAHWQALPEFNALFSVPEVS